jgi:riboflavin kinase/FMN adenylyltransferase
MNKKIYALGFFDGVHLGHQALLEACWRMAAEKGCQTAAITFEKHPKALFLPTPPVLINSIEDRKALLRSCGMEAIRVLPVTRESMAQPWQDFLEGLCADGAAGFVCGDDFRFGHKGEGNAEKLQAFCEEKNLPCVIVPEQTMDGIRISSTHIRQLIEHGEMEMVAKFLGHPHILGGEVVHGRHLGRTIGVPTANVLIPDGVALPKMGVYACTCVIDEKNYVAVTNIGSRPTVDGHQVRAESWILDFDGELYDRRIVLRFHKFLRPEQKFGSLEELKAQIRIDAAEAYRLLK